MAGTEHAAASPSGQNREDSNRKRFGRSKAKIIVVLVGLFGFAGAFLVMTHTEHVLMAVPFLILALVPLLAVITMHVLGRADEEERGAHIGSGSKKRNHRRPHHGQA